MNDRKNLTIGLLCVSATLLAAAWIFLHHTDGAVAATAQSRGGDYIAATASITSNTDLVYVIDLSAQRMNAYAAPKDNKRDNIVRVDAMSVDLRRLFDKADTDNRSKR